MISSRLYILAAAMTVLSFLLIGCGRASENTLKDILVRDPSFSNLLDMKNNVTARIAKLKDEYNKEKASILQKITLLKEGLNTSRNKLKNQTLSLRQELEPKIGILKNKLTTVEATYRLKKQTLRDSMGKLQNINKLLSKKGELSLSGDEVLIWNKRSNNLEGEISSLQKDLDGLRDKIRILKTEIKILSQ